MEDVLISSEFLENAQFKDIKDMTEGEKQLNEVLRAWYRAGYLTGKFHSTMLQTKKRNETN